MSSREVSESGLQPLPSWYSPAAHELRRGAIDLGTKLNGYAARQEWRQILQDITDVHRLEHCGRKIYSQNDEDGILEEIFRRIGITQDSGHFVEFGAADGLENNTLYLLHRGFRGLWIESSDPHVQAIRNLFGGPLAENRLKVAQAVVTAENVSELIAGSLPTDAKIAVLSIDIDGNDFWVWKAFDAPAPAVVVIEYNGKFPPPLSIAQRYQPELFWRFTDYFGASLQALVRLAHQKGYQLVSCNVTGANAFFVRDDLVADHFPYPLTAMHLYHPCRYHLTQDCFRWFGHTADFGDYVTIG